MAFESAKYFLSADNADTNCSLCCGLAGESYASLTLYNLTGETFYLTRAKTMSKTILENVYSPQMRNNSLYKGDIGAGILFSELAQPQNARMPLFEL